MLNKLSEATGNRLSVEELKQYQVFTEVPLIVNAEGGFMKADIVLVKIVNRDIKDVIVIENKLSKATEFTKRQTEGFRAILKNGSADMKLKYKIDGFNWKNIHVSENNIYRFHDHGLPDGAIEIEKITGSMVKMK